MDRTEKIVYKLITHTQKDKYHKFFPIWRYWCLLFKFCLLNMEYWQKPGNEQREMEESTLDDER